MPARAQTKTSSTNSPEKPRTIHYELKFEELKYVFGPLPPVMRVHAGDIIDTTTVDADGKALEAAGLKVVGRSEERRVGKECRSRWSPYH